MYPTYEAAEAALNQFLNVHPSYAGEVVVSRFGGFGWQTWVAIPAQAPWPTLEDIQSEMARDCRSSCAMENWR